MDDTRIINTYVIKYLINEYYILMFVFVGNIIHYLVKKMYICNSRYDMFHIDRDNTVLYIIHWSIIKI